MTSLLCSGRLASDYDDLIPSINWGVSLPQLFLTIKFDSSCIFCIFICPSPSSFLFYADVLLCIWRPSQVYYANPYTNKAVSSYWIEFLGWFKTMSISYFLFGHESLNTRRYVSWCFGCSFWWDVHTMQGELAVVIIQKRRLAGIAIPVKKIRRSRDWMYLVLNWNVLFIPICLRVFVLWLPPKYPRYLADDFQWIP